MYMAALCTYSRMSKDTKGGRVEEVNYEDHRTELFLHYSSYGLRSVNMNINMKWI